MEQNKAVVYYFMSFLIWKKDIMSTKLDNMGDLVQHMNKENTIASIAIWHYKFNNIIVNMWILVLVCFLIWFDSLSVYLIFMCIWNVPFADVCIHQHESLRVKNLSVSLHRGSHFNLTINHYFSSMPIDSALLLDHT